MNTIKVLNILQKYANKAWKEAGNHKDFNGTYGGYKMDYETYKMVKLFEMNTMYDIMSEIEIVMDKEK